ncbi:hypothetical protein [Bacteroides fragilis]|uniref:hypothetical protein n=1 Tax=Bacteroides fragilis TaxID=817 RepID=UPI00321B43CF
MKQPIEEAAREYYEKNYQGLDLNRMMVENAFEAGADWQSKQSPWISVEERLPEYPCWVLVTGKRYKYRILFYCRGKFYTDKSLTLYDGSVLFWIPIPSLDKDL